MILSHEVEQVSSFFLRGWVHVLSGKALVDITQTPLKGIILFIAEYTTLIPIPHGIYEIPAFLVGQYIGMGIPLRLLQALVVVIIQQIQRAGVLLHHFQYLG